MNAVQRLVGQNGRKSPKTQLFVLDDLVIWVLQPKSFRSYEKTEFSMKFLKLNFNIKKVH